MTKLLLKLFVRSPEPYTSPEARGRVGSLSGAVGIVCNILLFIMKLAVGILSGSVSITADALNNLTDASSSVVSLVGFRLARKPADEDHPYGHARFEYLSGLAVAALIIVIGFELGKTSVEKIMSPTAVTMSIPVYVVLGVSILVKLWLSLFNRTLGKKISSGTLIATSVDSRNDTVATLAVLLSGILEASLNVRLDGYIGLAVSAFILYSGVNLAKDTISPLLGENASPELKEKIVDTVSAYPEVLGYHDLMVHDYGPGQRFASMHIEMDHERDVMECHELIDNLERLCLERHNVHLVIHYDPVVTGDEELDRLRSLVLSILREYDERISIHDFRMVRGKGHTNLIFDAAVPAEKMCNKREIKEHLDKALAEREDKTLYTVITFDILSFN